jgi:competence protein ComEA
MILNFIYKKRTLIGGLLILIILIGAGLIIYSMNKNKEEIKTTDNSTEITVDIEGAVKNPGVYKLKNGSIIQDAINSAGGLNENVDNDLMAKDINRAETLKNNQKLLIPILTQTGQQVAGTNTETVSANKINLNTASLEQLDSLPGIGPVYAQRIIEYRKKKQFSSLEEVMEIQGIGEKTYEKMKDLITI